MEKAAKYKEILKEYDRPETKGFLEREIDRNRKGNFSVRLSGEGAAKVRVRQIGTRFRFGANLFLLDEMETEEKNLRYRENFARVMNYATVAMYWNDLEPERGKPRFEKNSPRVYRRPALDLCEEFCLSNHIGMKGHCLNYEPMIPDWAKKLDYPEYLAALETRVQMIAARYGQSMGAFEVTNEITSHWDRKNWTSPLYVDPDVIPYSFRMARKYLPKSELIINEGQDVAFAPALNGNYVYPQEIRYALDHGAEIDGIGLQAHLMWVTPQILRPETMWENMEIYRRRFGLPLQITECTCPSVFDGEPDRETQADLLEKFYTVCFAHPAMEGIIYWNLTDGYAYNAKPGDMTAGENVYAGGLTDFDGSGKPAYEVLDRLIHETWNTDFTQTAEGTLDFRGFYGDYEITVEREGRAPSVFRTSFLKDGDVFRL